VTDPNQYDITFSSKILI